MLERVKSSYILKEIFLYVEEKDKLFLIMYNKLLQKILGADLEYYKKISGRYKVGKKNGFGKEYKLNTNILKFEGEYLNGKRNGKGKEYYDNDQIEYEGEYLNGKRNGKGIEYNNSGKLIFKGEYLNGKRWSGKVNNNDIQLELKNGYGNEKN